jgi:hypothetical protein
MIFETAHLKSPNFANCNYESYTGIPVQHTILTSCYWYRESEVFDLLVVLFSEEQEVPEV